ncbi:hypothetical protein ACFE04_013111 [Oxalis oulophora]
MGFLKKIAGIFGFAKEEDNDDHHHDLKDQDNNNYNNSHNNGPNFVQSGLPRKGFGVPVQVAVDRPQLGPVIIPCSSGDGGVQDNFSAGKLDTLERHNMSSKCHKDALERGLKWHTKRLRVDEDGDVAEEFLDEILPEAASSSLENQTRPMPGFVLKCNTTPAKVKNQVLSADGRIQQCVEYKGRLQWV